MHLLGLEFQVAMFDNIEILSQNDFKSFSSKNALYPFIINQYRTF
jgi:hypothetical protein